MTAKVEASNLLRVFVSSTMAELRDVREIVGKALTDRGIKAVVYEAVVGAEPDPIISASLREVEESDVYVGLFWKKYGNITIEEFHHARKRNKPCFIYIRDQNALREPALEDFLSREVCNPILGVAFAFFTSILLLGEAVANDIMRWLVRCYRETSVQIHTPHMSLEELKRLQAGLDHLQAFSREPLPQGDALDNLARQLWEWFQALGYGLERDTDRLDGHIEMIVNIPRRRSGHDRILVHVLDGEIRVEDVNTLGTANERLQYDEVWLLSERRVSKAARENAKKHKNVSVFTLDELIDQEVSWDPYFEWLEEQVKTKGIDRYYVHLTGTVDDFDKAGRKLGTSHYEKIDDYFHVWLDDPSKEHISILGEFGTGKTWFTLHFAYEMLKQYREAAAKGLKRPRVPLIIRLRNYAQGFKDVGALLTEFIFREHEIRLPGYRAFEQLNRMGRLLLIFDGFDEMAARVDRQRMVNNFWELAKVVVPNSKAILTCRTEHFQFAQQERDVLGAKLKASTGNITLEPPKFEVLHLEMFHTDQIREVLRLRTSRGTLELIMNNSELVDMARRPVLIEFILEAMPEVEGSKVVSMAHVYYYAVRRKMERDIREERTFTSLADKLYFLCELSWEMLSTNQMSLNYKLFPERIRRYFGNKVVEVEEDHWHYDLLGQTMLVRDADGNYSPAHRSLLEFFVAYKFAAEMGALDEVFIGAARTQSSISNGLRPQDYSWSTWFRQAEGQKGQQAIAPLRNFDFEPMEQLASTLGAQPLVSTILTLLEGMVLYKKLPKIIMATQGLDAKKAGYVGGNVATMLNRFKKSFGELPKVLSRTVLVGADLRYANLRKTNLRGANLTSAVLRGANMRYADFRETIVSGALISDAAPRFLSWHPDGKYLAGCGNCDAIQIWKEGSWQEEEILHAHEGMVEAISWSDNGKWLASGGTDCKVRVWDSQTLQVRQPVLQGLMAPITTIAWSPRGTIVAAADRLDNIRTWNIDTGQVIGKLTNLPGIASILFNADGTHLAIACASFTSLFVWEIATDRIVHREIGHFLSHYKHYRIDSSKWDLASVKQFGFPEWVPIQQPFCVTSDPNYAAVSTENFVQIWTIDPKEDCLKECVNTFGGRLDCQDMLIKGIQGLDDVTYRDLVSRGANATYDGLLARWWVDRGVHDKGW